MKRRAIAISLLVLFSFQIAVAIANTPTTTVNQSIDRSRYHDIIIVPRSGPPIVFVFKYGESSADINVSDYLKGDLLFPDWNNSVSVSP